MSSMPPRTYVNRHANLNAVQLGNKKSGFAGGVGMGYHMNRLYRSKAHVSVVGQATIFSMNPNAGGVGRGRSVFGGSGFPRMDGFFRRAPYRYPIVTPAPALLSSLSVEPDYYNGIFSLKLLNKDYDGPVAYVRREIDDVSNDFYSTTSGELTSAEGTTIAAFLANTTGRVRSWYDQSGKANHATQTVATLQPTIDLTNNCLDFGYASNTGLFLNMPPGTVPVGTLNAPYSFVVKHGYSDNTVDGAFIGAGDGTANRSNVLRFQGNIQKYHNYWHSNDFSFEDTIITIPKIVAVTYNGSVQNGYQRGSLIKTMNTRTGATTSASNQKIGLGGSAREKLDGQLYSVLIFSTALPQSDVAILNSL